MSHNLSVSLTPVTFTWPSHEKRQAEKKCPFGNPFEIFRNTFQIEDVLSFDQTTFQRILKSACFHLTIDDLASAFHHTSEQVRERIYGYIPPDLRAHFERVLSRALSPQEIQEARERILHSLFWELIYWKVPELYNELTEGESLHPGICNSLARDIRGRVVLDAAAGAGRVTFECLKYRPGLIYAVDPSPGMVRLLSKKLASRSDAGRVLPRQGSFEHLPLADNSVDLVLTCSAFRSTAGYGGEAGLAEMRRVSRQGGKLVMIWPAPADYAWFARHGFHYIAFQEDKNAVVRFSSLDSAFRCAQLFYTDNTALLDYLRQKQQAEVPFSLLAFHQPYNYCWLTVQK